MQKKRWIHKPLPAAEYIQALRESVNLSELTATLLLQRGVQTFEQARHFFRDTLDELHDPFLMQDMDKAVHRLLHAIEHEERLLFFGDYDVDGTTSVSLFMLFFRTHFPQVPCDFYVPDRYTEGYGVSTRGIDLAAQSGCRLMITLDCGIRSVEKVQYAKEKGIEVIVCDHHEPGPVLPDAVALLDPKIPGNAYPFKELSGCGVGFKLLQALCMRKGVPLAALYAYLDLVAISTACDIVPIVGENRILVREGLKLLNATPRTGIKALIDVARFKNQLSVSNLVFGIGPRINAAGRIAHANHAVNLLITDSEEEASEYAKSVDVKNELRKDYDAHITEEALEQIAQKQEPYYTNVLFKNDWHKGVIGIVASRCIEKYHRPTIILTESNGKATGSARSVPGVDVHAAIDACGDLLEQYGGHTHAAGLTLSLDNLAAFSERFEQAVAQQISYEALTPALSIDLQIQLGQITLNSYKLIREMAPFGPANLQPFFSSSNVRVVGEIRILKEKHLKFSVAHPNDPNTFDVIGFNKLDLLPLLQADAPFAICYQIELNEYQGNKSLQLLLADVQPMDEHAGHSSIEAQTKPYSHAS